jgi:ribonucleoside-diphosphate reductase alpha chain
MSDAAASPEADALRGLAEPSFDPNAMRVLKERYFARKPDGTQEMPKEFLWRVASAIAQPERPYAEKNGRDPDAVVDGVSHAFYDMMARRDFMPNTPCLVNAGRPLSMLSACFVLPVPDSIEGIFYNLKAMALVQQGGGGCISGDARVWSTFCGIEPIEVLFSRTTSDGRRGVTHGNGVAYDVRDLNVKTLSMQPQTGELGLKLVSHVWKFDVPANEQIVVRMREGTRVQTSSWHPFMVVRGTRLVEVRADELTPGDVVLGPENPEAFWPWKEYQTVADLPLDKELAWLIGFTLGDGSFGRNKALGTDRVRWFSGTEDVLHRVRGILMRYGIEVGMTRDSRGNGLYVTTSSQWFIQALRKACGIASNGPKDLTIRVPEMIGKSPLPVTHAFLAGLLDSDGCVDKDGSPSYTTASEAMAEDLAALLGLLGFQPTIKRKQPQGRGKHPTYTVLLARRTRVDDLARRIASYMSCEARKQRLRGDFALDMRQLHMPFRTWRDELRKHGLIGNANVGPGPVAAVMSRWACNYAGRTRRADLLAIADVLEPHDAPVAALLRRIGNSGQEIKSVEKASAAKPFYDLTVDDWNTYAAGNGGMTMIHNTGFAFSQLRPSGSLVATTGRDASGPVSFMKVFNAATDSIKQGGVRRGANMAVLRVDHPDIFDFMRCKKELDAENRALWNRFSDTGAYTDEELSHIKQELLQTQMNNFNVSVGVTDAFMDAVERDGDFDLIDPRTKVVVQTVRAREIWDAIVAGAWQNGEPGVIFLDHPEANPLPGLGPIEATNPCGEQLLHGYDSCNLGSINVGQFYNASAKDVDWERLAQATTLSIRFLDNVIDANIYPLKEIGQMVLGNRRVGLGIMGFADLLIQMEVAYGSPEAIAFAEKLMKFLQQRAEETSELIARERGDFPNKHLSKWADDPRPRRNAALLSIAPTGTISMIAGCSFGCEPYFGMAYTKHVMKDSEGRPQHLYYVVPLFEEVAKDEGFFSDALLSRIEENRGSVKGLPEVPQHWQDIFTTSADVAVDQHIDMLAAFQKYTCNAVSKTINAPNNDTMENVARSIIRAYKKGCKGFTYYRDGSRTEQVVTFSREGDIKGGNRDIAARAETDSTATAGAAAAAATPTHSIEATTESLEELDIEELLAKANALLEAH